MEKIIGIKVNLNNNIITVNKKKKQINKSINNVKDYSLPKDFFETVLEYEIKLKEKFDIKIFQKLATYYSTAIEYYERNNDPKFMIYNQNLSLLFEHPEAKKYLTKGKAKEKLRKEKIKIKIQNCDKKITIDKIKNFIKRKETVDAKKIIRNLIEKDIDKQSNDFKKRLADKKRKYQLSISDNLTDSTVGNIFKNIGIKTLCLSENNDNTDCLSISNIDLINQNSIYSNNDTNLDKNNDNENMSVEHSNNLLNELKKQDINHTGTEIVNHLNNIFNDSFNNKLNDNQNMNNQTLFFIKNNIKYTNKTLFLEKMKFNFDIYSNDYYEHFIRKIITHIINDYNNNYNELTETLTDSIVNSINQEKEMEYLITSDSDETYTKEIMTIINQLKEEEKESIQKIISENKDKIELLNNKYIGPLNSFQSCHELRMLRERLKLDITKNLNDFVFK